MNNTTNNTFTFYEIYDADILRDRYGINDEEDFYRDPEELIDAMFNIEYSFNSEKICNAFNYLLETEIKTYCEPLNVQQIIDACIKIETRAMDTFTSNEVLPIFLANEIYENLIAVTNTGTEQIKFYEISPYREEQKIINFLENLLSTELVEIKRELSCNKE